MEKTKVNAIGDWIEALSRSTIAIVRLVSDDFHSEFIYYYRSAIYTSLYSLLLRFSRAFAQFVAMHASLFNVHSTRHGTRRTTHEHTQTHKHRKSLSALAHTTFFPSIFPVHSCCCSSFWTRNSTQNQTSTIHSCFEFFFIHACFCFFEFLFFFLLQHILLLLLLIWTVNILSCFHVCFIFCCCSLYLRLVPMQVNKNVFSECWRWEYVDGRQSRAKYCEQGVFCTSSYVLFSFFIESSFTCFVKKTNG